MHVNTADSLSFQSLHVVRDELVSTIEQAARDLEVYVTSFEEVKSLEASVASIRQILGIFKLLELKGASMLAEELLITARIIKPGEQDRSAERNLELVSNTFFVLSRYLEYVSQAERKIPVLLIPYINELRKFRREPVLPESFFFNVSIKNSINPPAVDPISVTDEEFRPLLVRLRHMYQLGLLAVLRNKQVPASLGLMRRALIRMQRLGNDKPLASLWWLANLAVDCMICQKMEVIEPRKMLLSRIDRIIRQVQKGGKSAYQAAAPKGLIKELLYIIVISGQDNEQVKRIRQTFEIRSVPYLEKQLIVERQALKGPSAHTLKALVRELRTEINNLKKVLETAAQGMQIIDDVEGFKGTLQKIAKTLSLVGMVGPSSILKEEISLVDGWESNVEVSEEDLDHIAKIVLYVESAVGAIEFSKFSSEQLKDTTEANQNQVIATSELSQAERIVMQECEAGLLLTKRAITSYSESSFDSGHIRNIAKTLSAVRGGFYMLGRERAARAMGSCVAFVEEVLMGEDLPAALKELLETFADAIIAVEYYLDSASTPERLDDSVLQVAEESLAALGYPVA